MSILALATFASIVKPDVELPNETGIFTGAGAVYGYVGNVYPNSASHTPTLKEVELDSRYLRAINLTNTSAQKSLIQAASEPDMIW